MDTAKIGAIMAPEFITAVYTSTDRNTADIYLSDLPLDRLLNPRDDLASATGSLVHIHLFILPQAGSTPIDDTACNVTIRDLILTGGGPRPAGGLYGGGGFIDPSDRPGRDPLEGSFAGATLRPLRASPGFVDRLGVCTLEGSFIAERNDAAAGSLGARFASIVDGLAVLSPPAGEAGAAPAPGAPSAPAADPESE